MEKTNVEKVHNSSTRIFNRIQILIRLKVQIDDAINFEHSEKTIAEVFSSRETLMFHKHVDNN